MPKLPGTILPTRADLARDDAFADREAKRLRKIGNDLWPTREYRREQAEDRWYRTPNEYSIVASNGQPRHFLIHANGDTFAFSH